MLDALVREGKIRLKGQSAYSEADFVRAVPVVKPAVLQSWANALARDFIKPGGVVPRLLTEHRMSYVAFSPLAQGLLLDKFDPEKPPTFEEGDHRRNSGRFTTEKLRALKPKLAQLKARFGATTEVLSAVAQRYLLNQPNLACVIPGFRNERQVECNLAATGRELSAEDMAFIERVLA